MTRRKKRGDKLKLSRREAIVYKNPNKNMVALALRLKRRRRRKIKWCTKKMRCGLGLTLQEVEEE